MVSSVAVRPVLQGIFKSSLASFPVVVPFCNGLIRSAYMRFFDLVLLTLDLALLTLDWPLDIV